MEEKREMVRVQEKDKREHPAPYLWCKIKHFLIEVLYAQG